MIHTQPTVRRMHETVRGMSYRMRLGKEPERFTHNHIGYTVFPLLFICTGFTGNMLVLRFQYCELDAMLAMHWFDEPNIIVKRLVGSGFVYYVYKRNGNLLGNVLMNNQASTVEERVVQGIDLRINQQNDITDVYERCQKIAGLL